MSEEEKGAKDERAVFNLRVSRLIDRSVIDARTVISSLTPPHAVRRICSLSVVRLACGALYVRLH